MLAGETSSDGTNAPTARNPGLPVPGGSQHGLYRPALQKGQNTITNRAAFKPASRHAKLLNVYSRPSESGSQSLRPACGSDLARWLSRRPCHYAHCFPTIKTLEIRLHSAASAGGQLCPDDLRAGWDGPADTRASGTLGARFLLATAQTPAAARLPSPCPRAVPARSAPCSPWLTAPQAAVMSRGRRRHLP